MPCSSDGHGEDLANIDLLTRLLCMACRAIEVQEVHSFMPAEVREWWTEHQQIDARRKAEEKRRARAEQHRRSALAKLTLDEQKALGLVSD